MARFLLNQRADTKLEDKYSLYVRQNEVSFYPWFILLSLLIHVDQPSTPTVRRLSSLHLIILGISRTNLDDYLQSSSADIDAQCSFGRAPLCWAGQKPNGYQDVQLLISHGATVRIPDIRGQTPLHLAAETGHYRSLQIILEAVSSLEGPHNLRQEVRDKIAAMKFEEEEWEPGSALESQSDECSGYISDFSLSFDSSSRTSTIRDERDHFAPRTNNVAHAGLLLRHGAKLNHLDSANRPPQFIALYWDHHEIV
ncbi:ankyrin repeat-containing domain protein [Lasiosphaeria miniovina]|uniref:Ankyrin repeat-containing domain protein n=1 Tax=Lasiosphaeria miniovina TaxID=1954250 RepID=A0AA40ATN5_9PEZI|nr:ankyrin repeat-containing domain protein [Lasiosphaeria miniovina]KAK0721793.1 ankyrin repeat-containing domain protein [Lasiosphaeria miniovina]